MRKEDVLLLEELATPATSARLRALLDGYAASPERSLARKKGCTYHLAQLLEGESVTIYGRLRSDDNGDGDGLPGGAYRGRAARPRVLVGSRE